MSQASTHDRGRLHDRGGRLLALSLLLVAAACQDRPTYGILTATDGGLDKGGQDAFIPDGLTDGALKRDATCATSSAEVGLLPLDMLVALDTSLSMDYLGKWSAVRKAIKAFVADPLFAGIGVGLQYFPLRKECSVDDYRQPAIPIASLPGVGPAIADSLDGQRMAGGTPMVPMLQGVLDYAGTWAKANPERKVVVIVATDGIPDNTCKINPSPGGLPNTLENVVAVADTGLKADPSITTFVIGVGSELTALNQIGQAGGSGAALLVDTAANIEKAFLEALNTVRLRAVSCEYEIPEPEGQGKIDFDRVNVLFRADGVSQETLVRVDDEASCAKAQGNAWYYDDPVLPKKIILCEEACSRVQSAVNAVVDVQFGCKTALL